MRRARRRRPPLTSAHLGEYLPANEAFGGTLFGTSPHHHCIATWHRCAHFVHVAQRLLADAVSVHVEEMRHMAAANVTTARARETEPGPRMFMRTYIQPIYPVCHAVDDAPQC